MACFANLKEHRMEIDSKAPAFEAFEQFSAELVANDHPSKDEIEEKLEEIRNERRKLDESVIFWFRFNRYWYFNWQSICIHLSEKFPFILIYGIEISKCSDC